MTSGQDNWKKTALLLFLWVALVCAGFVPGLWGVWVWVGPAVALVAGRRSPLKRLWWTGWAAGYAASLFLYYWLAYVTVGGWLLLGVYTGVYQAVFLVGVEVAARRYRAPRVLSAVCLWVILEYLRGVLFTGLPWFYLGHALYRWGRMIQSADIGGVIFLGGVVMAVNAMLAEAVAGRGRRRAAWVLAAAGVFAANLGYGAWRFATVEEVEGPMVALVQPNVPQGLKIEMTSEEAARVFMGLRAQTLSAEAGEAEVIFWPETIMPGFVGIEDYTVAGGMTAVEVLGELRAQGVEEESLREIVKLVGEGEGLETAVEKALGQEGVARLGCYNMLRATAKMAGKYLFAGAIPVELGEGDVVKKAYNRAYLFDGEGREVSFYDKVHLVPFGEYVPFRESFPPAARALGALMPVKPLTYSGRGRRIFEAAGVKWGPAICFEDTFSYIGREYRLRGADILVNLTNDGWFKGSFELEAHLGNSVFRAVETRMGVVRAANTGVSAVISPRGEVTARLEDGPGRDREVSGVLVARTTKSGQESPYMVLGEWWILVLAVAWGGSLSGVLRGGG